MGPNLPHKQVELLGVVRHEIKHALLHPSIDTGLDSGNKRVWPTHQIDCRRVFVAVVGEPLQHLSQPIGRGLQIDVEVVLMGKA